jgi:hypothetical protein
MSLQSFETDVLSDIHEWAGKTTEFLEAECRAAWDLVWPILSDATPAEIAVLKGFIQDVLDELPTVTDLPTLETALLNSLEKAGAAELAVAKAMGSKLLQALIAVVAAL